MRRLPAAALPLALALLAAPAAAQDASSVASPVVVPGSLTEPFGLLVVGPGRAVPVARLTIAPGAALPPSASPGVAVAQVETGQVGFAAVEGVVRRARLTVVPPTAATPMAATPAAGTPAGTPVGDGTPTADGTPRAGVPTDAYAVVEEEVIVVGEATLLNPGEGVAFDTEAVHTFRNTGNEPAVLLIVGEFPPDQPFRVVEGAAVATPKATSAS